MITNRKKKEISIELVEEVDKDHLDPKRTSRHKDQQNRNINMKGMCYSTTIYVLCWLIIKVLLVSEVWMLQLRNVNEHQCERLAHPQLFSPEDMVVYEQYIIVGSYDRIHNWYYSTEQAVGPAQQPFFYLYIHNNHSILQPLEIIQLPQRVQLRPFGLRVFKHSLYMLNDLPDDSTVEVFNIITNTTNNNNNNNTNTNNTNNNNNNNNSSIYLQYSHTIELGAQYSSLFNSIEVLNDDELLVTQWRLMKGRTSNRNNLFDWLVHLLVQSILQMKVTQVYFCNRKGGCQPVHNSYAVMNNGIQISVNYPNRVMVADTLSSAINVYQFHNNTLAFTKINTLILEDTPDNIHVDPITKQYYIGCNSKTSDFLSTLHRLLAHQPTSNHFHHGSVYELMEFNNSHAYSVNKIFRTNHLLNAVSSAQGHQNHYYVGAVLDNAILSCLRDNFHYQWGLIH